MHNAKKHSLRYTLKRNASCCREVLWQWELGPELFYIFSNDTEEEAYTTFVKSEDSSKLGGAAGSGEDGK